MTRDTKIGLLLGLVFIFIIAFLINGIPLRKGGATAPGTPTRKGPVSVGGNTRTFADHMNQGRSPYRPPVPPPEQGRQDGPRSTIPLPGTDRATPAQTAGQFGSVDHPGTPGPGQSGESPWPVQVPSNPGLSSVASDALVPVHPIVPIPQPGDGGPGSVAPSSPMTVPPVGPIPGPSVPREGTPTPAVSGWPKTHVVKEGDSLEAIAKHFYGEREGAKPSSITRIFEANKTILKSPDRLSIGQKLTVPAPAGTAAPQPVQPATSPRPAVAATPSAAPSQRVYTIQEGDSLWSIAEAQLGQGTRYKEILKLNAGTLREEDVLEPGAALKLPPK
ncbi:MAG: LysM peptidoglycan-binding domain-containing protein [Phycisphaerae bacterium]|nr:LysM peptidoglycan-binding domain-containing protein [Phycisphaerae bacterium]